VAAPAKAAVASELIVNPQMNVVFDATPANVAVVAAVVPVVDAVIGLAAAVALPGYWDDGITGTEFAIVAGPSVMMPGLFGFNAVTIDVSVATGGVLAALTEAILVPPVSTIFTLPMVFVPAGVADVMSV